jgi:hypothetical protein
MENMSSQFVIKDALFELMKKRRREEDEEEERKNGMAADPNDEIDLLFEGDEIFGAQPPSISELAKEPANDETSNKKRARSILDDENNDELVILFDE